MDTRRFSDRACEWFAVQVWTGREQLTAQHLRLRGYEVFLPQYSERHRWSDRVKQVDRALFAGYAFCRTTPDAGANIVATPGVIRIVSDGRQPLAVPAHEIEAIQRLVEIRLPMEPLAHLPVGQRVVVEAGPLRGVEGVVLTVKNGHRLVLSVALLQRSVAVEIESEWVEPCRS